MQTRLMRFREVSSCVGLKRTRIYELMAEGKFPKARRIGERAVAWSSREIDQWVADRLEGRA